MSKYTTEVRFICETYAGKTESEGFDKINEIVEAAQSQIFENYPIFDETYRNVLNTKILRHYYTREICAETVGLWKLWLNNRMNEIMPKYNKLYESELLKFNPFYDTNLSRTHTKSENTNATLKSNENTGRNGSGENSSNDNSAEEGVQNITDTRTANKGHVDKYSDTPQGELDDVVEGKYLTNARVIDEDETDTNTAENVNSHSVSNTSHASYNSEETQTRNRKDDNNIANTEAYLERVQGKANTASYSKLLNEYRETFLNIDKMVIDELADLFFNLW